MQKIKKALQNKETKYLLGLILFVAILLRFWNAFAIPYTYDELSSLFRSQYESFSELIQEGVMIDAHPAGGQILWFYWTKLFGTEPFIVKIPYLLMGLGSVVLTYSVGQKWFNSQTGIVSAAYVASIQYTVMYSQIARPYISGMFFVLLMVLFWTRLMQNPESHLKRNAVFYILSSALCAYNHHFSLLIAAMVGLSGLFLLPRKYLLRYIISGLLIFLLYTPHLKIFFVQLSKGGVEQWLAKPDFDWPLYYISYVFQFNDFALIFVAALSAFSIYTGWGKLIQNRFFYISILWFLLPFLIGFFYSKYISAVLQPSVLIFSFPFFLYILFGGISIANKKIFSLLIIGILLINSLLLIFVRDHYSVFYKSVYKELIVDQNRFAQQYGLNIYSTLNAEKAKSDYYIKANDLDTSTFIWQQSIPSISAFRDTVQSISKTKDAFFYGALSASDARILPVVLDFFPNIHWQGNYAGGTSFLLHKKGDSTTKPVLLATKELPWNESLMNGTKEWGASIELDYNNINAQQNDFIDIRAHIISEHLPKELLLVCSIKKGDSSLFWQSSDCADFYPHSDTAKLKSYTAHLCLKLSDMPIETFNDAGIKFFIWNKGRNSLAIEALEISRIKGNPNLYGIFEALQ